MTATVASIKIITLFVSHSTLYICVAFYIISSIQILYVSSISPVTFTVNENCGMNYIVGDMSLYKLPNNGTISTKIYSLESIENDQFKELFVINSQSGIIQVNRPVDREVICPQLSGTSGTCSVTLLVTILNDILNIVIIIVDENDNAPSFLQSTVTISVKESSPVGTMMYLGHAKDLDSSYNGVGEYSLTTESGGEVFKLRYNSSVIYLESSVVLDYEQCQSYQLTLSVCDIGTPKLCTSQSVMVMIIDINDNYPIFSKSTYLAIINEDHSQGKEILQISAIDKDSPQYGLVRYRISSINNEAKSWFRLDPVTGKIFLIQALATKIRNFKFVAEAYDNGPIPNVNRTLVTIHVKDVNNHYPEIKIRKSTFQSTIVSKGQYKTEVSFYENNPNNTDVVFVVVTDEDSDENGLVQCSMEQNEHKVFELQKFNWNRNKVIYRLMVLESTDCEMKRRYVMIINCSDSGDQPKMTLQTLEIVILDVNEFTAKFNQSLYTAAVREDSVSFGIAMPIIDEDCTVDFSVVIEGKYAQDHFKYILGAQQLVLSLQLDYEQVQTVKFLVKIIDRSGDRVTLSWSSVVDISVIDVNDNAPTLIDPSTFYVEENTRIGVTIGQLQANDSDEGQNSKVQFQKLKVQSKDDLSSDSNNFFVTSDGAIKLAKELDREKQDLYLLTIEVSDMGSVALSSTGTISVVVLDVNDNTPQWVFPNNHDNKINESIYTSERVVITRVHAVDLDGPGNNNITYHLLTQTTKDFFLHPIKGELSFITPPRIGVFSLDLLVSDNGHPQKVNKTTLTIYVSENEARTQSGDRSYFTIVAVVPVLILICVLVLILCLLLMVRRRNARIKNRRSQVKVKHPEVLTRKQSNVSNTNEKLLAANMMELHPLDELAKTHRLDTLDLTQTKSLPKVSYQCLVANDLDVCSADSGQGASEEDFSNYFMLKSNDPYRMGPCSQHCCSPLPENSIAHFICSTINHPIMYGQPLQTYGEVPHPFPCSSPTSSPSSSKVHLSPTIYNVSNQSPSYIRH